MTDAPEINVDELLRNGWTYKDFTSWVREETFLWLLEQMGDDNVKILACSHRTDWPDGPWMRGQILISDEGRKRLLATDLTQAPGIDRGPPQGETDGHQR